MTHTSEKPVALTPASETPVAADQSRGSQERDPAETVPQTSYPPAGRAAAKPDVTATLLGIGLNYRAAGDPGAGPGNDSLRTILDSNYAHTIAALHASQGHREPEPSDAQTSVDTANTRSAQTNTVLIVVGLVALALVAVVLFIAVLRRSPGTESTPAAQSLDPAQSERVGPAWAKAAHKDDAKPSAAGAASAKLRTPVANRAASAEPHPAEPGRTIAPATPSAPDDSTATESQLPAAEPDDAEPAPAQPSALAAENSAPADSASMSAANMRPTATVLIEVSPPDAVLSVDGYPVPVQGGRAAVRVAAGTHHIRAIAGAREVAETLVVDAGSRVRVDLAVTGRRRATVVHSASDAVPPPRAPSAPTGKPAGSSDPESLIDPFSGGTNR